MKKDTRGSNFVHRRLCRYGRDRWWLYAGLAVLVLVLGGTSVQAQSRIMDADLSDWCLGAFSNTVQGGGRTEDSSVSLSCGNCSVTTDQACGASSDCPGLESCVNPGSVTEVVWWDNRTDGAVNDLGTVATAQDNLNLYIAAELWVDPDPVSLPFGEFGIDFTPGGNTTWHDPNNALTSPGTCSTSTTRACTADPDCHFCAVSTEPFPSTRKRTCGSGCNPMDPLDVCVMTETCTGVGPPGSQRNVGLNSEPGSLPDYLVVFDFSRWLIGLQDATMLMADGPGEIWQPRFVTFPQVNPGASGGSGGPPGSVEVAIPWSAFGCTGCPACSCPDFGPGQPFRFNLMIARGTLSLDYTPDGALEDALTEAVGGTGTTTTDNCPGMGIGTTNCETADGSQDAALPPLLAANPGGQAQALKMSKGVAPAVTLDWVASCSQLDTDYEIYEGGLNALPAYNHTSVACTTGGAKTATIAASAGATYYLVVPTNGVTEGSYGQDSSGAERPFAGGAGQCAGQSLGGCP